MAKYFTVTVLQDGRPAKDVKVAGGIDHFIYVGQTAAVYTDNDGVALIQWQQDTYLDEIYVDGTGYRGEYYDGGNKLFSI